MNTDDRPQFAQAFNRLAVACRLSSTDTDPAAKRIYFDALADLPLDLVEQAADHLAKTAKWFPKVAEWAEAARTIGLRQVLALPEGRENPWTHECEVCEDTGWEERTCYPGTPVNCGHQSVNPTQCCDSPNSTQKTHTFVSRCACRDTNSTYKRKHAATRGGA
jgi:hypothetical protein